MNIIWVSVYVLLCIAIDFRQVYWVSGTAGMFFVPDEIGFS